MRRLILILLFILALAQPLLAASAVNCHCFQDRAFDPQTPERVDPYLLATTRNSFMANVFKIPRKTIVRARMTGTSDSELWLAHYLSVESGKSVADLRSEHQAQPSWHQLYQKHLPLHPLLAAGRSDQQLSAAVVDTLVAKHLRVAPVRIAELRSAGATDPQVILALLLARWTHRDATAILTAVTKGTTSWGRELNTTGRQPQTMEAVIKRELTTR